MKIVAQLSFVSFIVSILIIVTSSVAMMYFTAIVQFGIRLLTLFNILNSESLRCSRKDSGTIERDPYGE